MDKMVFFFLQNGTRNKKKHSFSVCSLPWCKKVERFRMWEVIGFGSVAVILLYMGPHHTNSHQMISRFIVRKPPKYDGAV